MLIDFSGKSVVVTRGTCGLGLAIGLAFGRLGARVYLVGRPDNIDAAAIRARFAAAQAAAPVLVAVADKKKAAEILSQRIADEGGQVHALISRVGATPVEGPSSLSGAAAFIDRVEEDAWHLVDYLYAIQRICGGYPRYMVALSSDACERYYPDYGAAAASQAVAEMLCRYLTTHLLEEEFSFNVLRTPLLLQEAGVGKGDAAAVTEEEVAGAALALCSGYLDALSGQMVEVDGGVRVCGVPSSHTPAGRNGGVALNDFEGKAVLVTGGTGGIGLETGLAFGRLGARVYLTYRWGTYDEGEVRDRFAAENASEPVIVEADVSNEEDTVALMQRIREEHQHLEVFINNVSFGYTGKVGPDLPFRELARSLRYSTWPLVAYLGQSRRILGNYPHYVVAISSPGTESFYPGYDLVASVKTAMETLGRYLAAELRGQDVHINILRASPVQTDSLLATFGPEFMPFCQKYDHRFFLLEKEDVARSALVLCSGLLDGLQGSTLLLDNGIGFSDNMARLFDDRAHYKL